MFIIGVVTGAIGALAVLAVLALIFDNKDLKK